MKKRILFLLGVLLTVACVLVGCKTQSEITSLRKVGDVLLRVGERAKISRFLEQEGEGELYYAVENPDVLQLDEGGWITGLTEGEGVVTVQGGAFVVRINVVVSEGERVRVTIADTTATYDGKKHNVGVSGFLPEGTVVRFYKDGEPFDGGIDAGEYRVTAEVELPEGYLLECEKKEAVLIVRKATYNLSGVHFSSRALTYTGTEQTVYLNGILPEGISVTYTGNRATDAGTYTARAAFSGENENYEKIPDMTCSYTIAPQLVDLSAKGFGNVEKTYDGEAYTLRANDLPSDTQVAYYVANGNEFTEVPAHTYVNAGTYPCYLRLRTTAEIAKNYWFYTATERVTFTQTDGAYLSDHVLATLTVHKAVLSHGALVLRSPDGYVAENMTFGDELTVGERRQGAYALCFEGALPEGIKGEFAGQTSVTYDDSAVLRNDRGLLRSGTQTFKARFNMPENYTENYVALGELTYRITVVRATYDDSSITFTTKSDTATFNGQDFLFTAEGYDEEEINVRYTYAYAEGGSALSVRHAGSYVVTARFTLKEDANDFYPIADRTLRFTVTPVRFDLDVTFDDVTTTYDGDVKRVTVTENEPLPEYMTVTYRNNEARDAGVYEATARFEYTEPRYYAGDYVVYVKGKRTNELRATLSVAKGKYTSDDVAGVAAATGLTYSYGMKLYAVSFTGDEDGYVQWKNANEEIGTLVSIDENTGYYDAGAVYFPERNSSKANYEPYEFTLRITLNKKIVDLTGATVPDQFVARTGNDLAVYVDFANGSDDELNREIVTTVTFTGAPLATVTVSPKREGNYLFIGQTAFENVAVYPYDATAYTYGKGTTSFTRFIGSGTVVDVPAGTTSIGTLAFNDTAVTAITVPETVISVAANAFYGAFSLTSLTLETLDPLDGSVKKAFGSFALENLKVTVKNASVIPAEKFMGMTYASSIKVETPVVTIGAGAFEGCSALTELTFNATQLKTVGENAFSGCTALTTLTLPSLVGEEEGSAVPLTYYFGTSATRCALESVTLTTTMPYVLADNAFSASKFSSLTRISLSPSLTAIGQQAFKDKRMDLDLEGTAITELGDSALSGFKGGKLILPAGLVAIGASALKDVCGVSALVVPAGVESIGRNAFNGCTANVTFEDGSAYTAVGESAFYGYSGESVTLPNVLSVGKDAFRGASDLRNVYLGTALTSIGEYAFRDCVSLQTITFPATLTEIGGWAFRSCSALTSVVFNGLNPPTPPTTQNGIFDTDGGLLTVVLKAGADAAAFENYLIACGREGTFVFSYKN